MGSDLNLRVYECPKCERLVVHNGKPNEEVECMHCGQKRFVQPTDKMLSEILTAMRTEIERQS